MQFVGEHAGLHGWIPLHDGARFVEAGVQHAHAGHLAAVADGARDRQEPILAEPEVLRPCSQMIGSAPGSSRFGPVWRMTTV